MAAALKGEPLAPAGRHLRIAAALAASRAGGDYARRIRAASSMAATIAALTALTPTRPAPLSPEDFFRLHYDYPIDYVSRSC